MVAGVVGTDVGVVAVVVGAAAVGVVVAVVVGVTVGRRGHGRGRRWSCEVGTVAVGPVEVAVTAAAAALPKVMSPVCEAARGQGRVAGAPRR